MAAAEKCAFHFRIDLRGPNHDASDGNETVDVPRPQIFDVSGLPKIFDSHHEFVPPGLALSLLGFGMAVLDEEALV